MLEIKLGAPCMLDKYSTSWATATVGSRDTLLCSLCGSPPQEAVPTVWTLSLCTPNLYYMLGILPNGSHILYTGIFYTLQLYSRMFQTLKQRKKETKPVQYDKPQTGGFEWEDLPTTLAGPEVADLGSHCRSAQWLERLSWSLLHPRLQFIPAQHTLFNHCEHFH